MAPRWLRNFFWVSVVALVASGCHFGRSKEDTVFAPPAKPYAPASDSSNAYDAYALAGLDAEAKGGKALTRVSFFPGEKKKAMSDIASAVTKVLAASKNKCDFKFEAHEPFTLADYQSGWRLIGRAILWHVELACEAGDFDKAVSYAVGGTRFGFGLTGGGATDTSLGLAIADELRRAIAPNLAKMSVTQLDRLAHGIKVALEDKPAISTAITNEQSNCMLLLQALQDAAKGGKLKEMQENFGPDSNEAIQRLGEIAGNDSKRRAYFEGLSEATTKEAKSVLGDVEIPASQWDLEPSKPTADWRKLAKQVYGTMRPMLVVNNATVARTRLLVLYAEVTRIWRRSKSYPANLDAFAAPLTTDPYSNKPFIYFQNPAEFKIYSVGMNGLDDGGKTDATFTTPDLRLEIPNPL